MSKMNNSRVQSNLLQQNCFVRDVTNKSGLTDSSAPDSFLSIDEVVTSKGIELKESVSPYPITPQYVDSFIASSDYRRDPFGAIANGSNRKNLGDVSSMQRVAAMDSSSLSSLCSDLKSKLNSVSEPKASSSSDPVVSGGDSNV